MRSQVSVAAALPIPTLRPPKHQSSLIRSGEVIVPDIATMQEIERAPEAGASVSVEIMPSFDRNRALQEVTAAVARISLFPDEIEPPNISLGTSRRRANAK